ncbi:hypothetical protein ALP29_201478 [Pseudomonas syringae pv. avii]|uniref:Uncharacterized protein n=1 Tax=Pseudomonas syringae pv. avii TaxID=663959 RepID=A0A3M5U4E3_PSESX|nr:hypothetical protein ALP29_201478 [Pseudomonas syringae pv. avii]
MDPINGFLGSISASVSSDAIKGFSLLKKLRLSRSVTSALTTFSFVNSSSRRVFSIASLACSTLIS